VTARNFSLATVGVFKSGQVLLPLSIIIKLLVVSLVYNPVVVELCCRTGRGAMLPHWRACISSLFVTLTSALMNGLGDRPPLAWSSWNYFANDVNETLLLETADALRGTGLAKLGFTTLNIDAGYLVHQRDESGRLQVNRSRFPHGIRWLAGQLHAKQMRLGVYTDLGGHSCGAGPGSMGSYSLDAQTFASWEIDCAPASPPDLRQSRRLWGSSAPCPLPCAPPCPCPTGFATSPETFLVCFRLEGRLLRIRQGP
jgi:hypothetical protein